MSVVRVGDNVDLCLSGHAIFSFCL